MAGDVRNPRMSPATAILQGYRAAWNFTEVAGALIASAVIGRSCHDDNAPGCGIAGSQAPIFRACTIVDSGNGPLWQPVGMRTRLADVWRLHNKFPHLRPCASNFGRWRGVHAKSSDYIILLERVAAGPCTGPRVFADTVSGKHTCICAGCTRGTQSVKSLTSHYNTCQETRYKVWCLSTHSRRPGGAYARPRRPIITRL